MIMVNFTFSRFSFSEQKKSVLVRALRKASTQKLTSSNTGYALSMADYYLFNKKCNSPKEIPKVLIVITDGRYHISFFVLDYTSGFIFTTAKVVLITAKIASIFPVHTSLVSL